MSFADELVATGRTANDGTKAFWEVLKIEIRALNAIGEKGLHLGVRRGSFYFTRPGSVLIPENYLTIPEGVRAFLEVIKPLCEQDGIMCEYAEPDCDGDGEGVDIGWW